MLIIIAALLAAVALVVLVRLLWLSPSPGRHSTLITLAAAALVLGLVVLAATGRLHWIAAVAAGIAPFLRRGLRLVRYLPWLGSILGSMRGQPGARAGEDRQRSAGPQSLSRQDALRILGLENGEPTRDEILSAHRRLIQKLHPDRGGSKYLAQQLNEAKQRLLADL